MKTVTGIPFSRSGRAAVRGSPMRFCNIKLRLCRIRSFGRRRLFPSRFCFLLRETEARGGGGKWDFRNNPRKSKGCGAPAPVGSPDFSSFFQRGFVPLGADQDGLSSEPELPARGSRRGEFPPRFCLFSPIAPSASWSGFWARTRPNRARRTRRPDSV